MGDGVTGPARGSTRSAVWSSDCKDCRAEQRVQRSNHPTGKRGPNNPSPAQELSFEYSGRWAERALDRGNSRSDRCERHRKIHARTIRALSVPYVDLEVIGEVSDPENPRGPLGALGPLPTLHQKREIEVDLAEHEFGMTDLDILNILEGLAEHQVAIVEAGTGTGKSTFMPFRMMNPPEGARFRPTASGPIIVTEPRRPAATGVARFVGEELGNGCKREGCDRHHGPGCQVGYQVSGDKRWDSACELIYVTDRTMINWVRDGQLARFGMVIIDEAHERSENIDVILAQLRELIDQHDHLRVVITSATLDREFFSSYFGGPERVFHYAIPAAKSFGYGVPLFIGTTIDEDVIEHGLAIGPGMAFQGWAAEGPSPDGDTQEKLRETTRTLEKLRCVKEIEVGEWCDRMPQAVVRQVVAIATGTATGNILAFLPTKRTIHAVVDEIAAELTGRRLDFDVFPLLSTTSPDVARRAIAAPKRGDKRKIVVSSNLAETSVTLKGIRYVVDSGLICQSEWDTEIASGWLRPKPHSQSGLRQRWGRVGRDMPGWVFPLYTPAQFLQLAKNTPPESTLINLETFQMKLLASGLRVEGTKLPGGFTDESMSLDAAGQVNVDAFRREIERASRALTLSGAVDGDGHLTSFGRELERFSGEGSHALALMLADQLACVHEVGLALSVLGSGRLAGRKEDSLLWVDDDWPLAWRVRAAQAHRALAIGCEDDLDVVLRIASLWQKASRKADWCSTWWVNEPALAAGLKAAADRVDSLSASMKKDAKRGIDPALAGRARAVLSRAMVSARYRRVADRRYRADDEGEIEEVTLNRGQFTEPADRVVALKRFRQAPDDGRPGPAGISHVIRLLDWAVLDGPGSDDIGFELALGAARHLPPNGAPDAKAALVEAAMAAIPVGTVVDLEVLDRGGHVVSFEKVEGPCRPRTLRGRRSGDDDEDGESGFDRDRDPHERGDAEEPEDERARKLNDLNALESNDEHANGREAERMPEPEQPEQPAFRAVAHLLETTLAGRVRGTVVGYRLSGPWEVTLLIDELERDQDGATTPLPDLIPWQELPVTVAGIIPSYDGQFLQLQGPDIGRRFYLEAWGAGLDNFDDAFITCLKPGAILNARVLCGGGEETRISLLPAARESLMNAADAMRIVRRLPTQAYRGKIIEAAEPDGWGVVELDARDAATGLSHRFGIRHASLKHAHLDEAAVGTPVLLALQSSLRSNDSAL